MPLDLSPIKKNNPGENEGKNFKPVLVEYLYLDLQVCDRCVGTEQVLEAVLNKLSPALQIAGYTFEYRKAKMDNPELAQQYQFVSSPTIRVNGRDICFNVQENPCDCCSDISGSIMDCRIFEYEGDTFEVPPQEMLAEAILKVVFGSQGAPCCAENEYVLPKNLQNFYEGKHTKTDCNCASNCC